MFWTRIRNVTKIILFTFIFLEMSKCTLTVLQKKHIFALTLIILNMNIKRWAAPRRGNIFQLFFT